MLLRHGKPLRALITEDQALVAFDLETTIRDSGGEVVGVAVSGEQAVEMARRLRPDLVLMDIRLAGAIDGIDAAAAVLAMPGTRLVFVTASIDESTLRRIRRLGDVRVLAKPVAPRVLLDAIRDACGLTPPRACAAAVWQVSAPAPRPFLWKSGGLRRRPALVIPARAVAPAEAAAMLRDQARELVARFRGLRDALRAARAASLDLRASVRDSRVARLQRDAAWGSSPAR